MYTFRKKCVNAIVNTYFYSQGDYNRYLAEFATTEPREDYSQKALKAYESATDIAAELSRAHLTVLTLVLHLSAYYYEILGDAAHAYQITKKAFDEAIYQMDMETSGQYRKKSTLILQLMRNTLSLWSAEIKIINEQD